MEKSVRQFGLLIAYLLPGFIALGGIAMLIPAVSNWLRPLPGEATAELGAPLYAVLAATTLGMVLSAFRFLIIDRTHFATGITPPKWDVDGLGERAEAFDQLIEYHFRYHQFYGHALLAVVWTYSIMRWLGTSSLLGFGTDLGVIILCAALFAGSRDAFAKYCIRTNGLIRHIAEKEMIGDFMTNGCHPEGGASKVSNKKAQKKETPKVEPVKSNAVTAGKPS